MKLYTFSITTSYRFHKKYFLYIFSLFFFFFSHTFVFANTTQNSQISLSISNSFSANTSLLSTGYTSGNITYVAHAQLMIQMHASTGSSFVVSGNDLIGNYTGVGVGNYFISQNIVLSGTDGIKEIPSMYTKGGEPLIATPIKVFLDTTAPSQANPLGPLLGSTQNGTHIVFSWQASTDTGAGIKEYRILISTDPGFSTPISFTTTQTQLSVEQNLLPEGILYRYVESKDHVGNISSGLPGFFTHTGLHSGQISSLNKEQNKKGKKHLDTSSYYPSEEKYDIGISSKNTKKIKLWEIFIRNIKNYIAMRSHTKKQSTDHLSPHNTHQRQKGEDIYTQLTLPGYLAKTGAEPQTIQKYLSLLATWSSDTRVKQQLQKILHFIQPSRPAGTIIFIFLLCYDVEIRRRWQRSGICNKTKKYKKSH